MELTREQAQMLCEAHHIVQILDDYILMELLEANNPGLAEAYYVLHRLAYGADEGCAVVNEEGK